MLLKIYFRNIKKHFSFFLINVIGLSVALGFSILVFLFLKSELGFDRFHKGANQIYRTSVYMGFRGGMVLEGTPFLLAETMENELSGVEKATNLIDFGEVKMEMGAQKFSSNLHLAGEEFFEIFNFPVVQGSTTKVLTNPNAIIINESAKERYFGSLNPIGQLVEVNFSPENRKVFTVEGVLKDAPENSSIHFEMIISAQNYRELRGERMVNSWTPVKSDVLTFFKKRSDVSEAQIVSGLNQISDDKGTTARLNSEEAAERFPIMKLVDLHFHNDSDIGFLKEKGNLKYVYVLGTVAALIILIAAINFANLSLGLSVTRSKEIGVRKVLGVHKGGLRRQFLFESFSTTFIGLVLGLLLAYASLPFFNNLVDKQLEIQLLADSGIVFGILCVGLVTGLLAGAYPAFSMSAFKVVTALNGKVQLKNGWLPKGMTILQFGVSMLLVISAMIMKSQLTHLSNYDLGFEKENLIYQTFNSVSIREAPSDAQVQLFRETALTYPNIVGVSSARGALFDGELGTLWSVEHQGERFTIPSVKVDHDFLDVMEIELLDGRNFKRDNPADGSAVIVNQAFIQRMEINEPIGKPAPLGRPENPIIIGVVEDFRFKSLRTEVGPLILNLRPGSPNSSIIVRVQGDVRTGLVQMQEAWEKAGKAGLPFEYQFFDEQLAAQYAAEQNFRAVINYASFFAVIIAAMGLVGLTSLNIARRTKEMSLRRVVGARMFDVLILFIRDVGKLIVLANLIFWPLAYWYLENWLGDFNVRVTQNGLTYLGIGMVVTVISGLIIMIQVWKTGSQNPVHYLRNE